MANREGEYAFMMTNGPFIVPLEGLGGQGEGSSGAIPNVRIRLIGFPPEGGIDQSAPADMGNVIQQVVESILRNSMSERKIRFLDAKKQYMDTLAILVATAGFQLDSFAVTALTGAWCPCTHCVNKKKLINAIIEWNKEYVKFFALFDSAGPDHTQVRASAVKKLMRKNEWFLNEANVIISAIVKDDAASDAIITEMAALAIISVIGTTLGDFSQALAYLSDSVRMTGWHSFWRSSLSMVLPTSISSSRKIRSREDKVNLKVELEDEANPETDSEPDDKTEVGSVTKEGYYCQEKSVDENDN